MRKNVREMLANINRRNLTTNTQRVLFTLLTATDAWVPRTSLRVNSPGARVRDLRKAEYGQFEIECVRASDLGRRSRVTNQTFYRINPNSVTPAKVAQVFEGVVATNVR